MMKERDGGQMKAKPRYRSHRIVRPNRNASGRLLRRNFLGRKEVFQLIENIV
jgi:hypothetical protein